VVVVDEENEEMIGYVGLWTSRKKEDGEEGFIGVGRGKGVTWWVNGQTKRWDVDSST
jgi:hypothetical protein